MPKVSGSGAGQVYLAPELARAFDAAEKAAAFRPFLIWMVVFFGLSNTAITDGTSLEQLYARVLKSPLALYFGSRSYSIYLCHYPVISVVAWLLFRWSVPLSMLILTIISIPLIIVIAEFAYRWIEKPGIAAGRMLISPSRATPQAGQARPLARSIYEVDPHP